MPVIALLAGQGKFSIGVVFGRRKRQTVRNVAFTAPRMRMEGAGLTC